MILFVTGFDEPTRSNLAVSALLPSPRAVELLGPQAIRSTLLSSLVQNPELPLFAMSHGGVDVLFGQDWERALTPADATSLSGRPVYIYACHTATELGRAATTSCSAWWGYTGAISAPSEDPRIIGHFGEIFSHIFRKFYSASSEETRRALIVEIENMCTHAATAFDTFKDIEWSAYSCLNHIWQRLRIWTAGSSEVEMHPAAPQPTLISPDW